MPLVYRDPQGSEAWLETRTRYLTATDVSVLCCKGSVEKGIWAINKIQKRDGPHSPALQRLFSWGHDNEAVAAQDLYDILTFFGYDVRVYTTGLHLHSNLWLAASPDRLFRIQKRGAPPDTARLWNVEIKCTHWQIPETPREEHIVQVRTQLEVLHSQKEWLDPYYAAPLAAEAILFYWCPRSAPRIFYIDRAPNFPYGRLQAFYVALQQAQHAFYHKRNADEHDRNREAWNGCIDACVSLARTTRGDGMESLSFHRFSQCGNPAGGDAGGPARPHPLAVLPSSSPDL